MFTTNKDYYSVHPSFINKPVPLYSHSGSNKENLNPFALKKTKNQTLSEPDPHSNHNQQKTLQNIPFLFPYGQNQTSHSSDQVSSGLDMTARQSSGTQESISRCEHRNVKSCKKTYCKDCGTFLPKVCVINELSR